MSDKNRELLLMAAKASGFKCPHGRYDFQFGMEVMRPSSAPFRWNPLNDDGDEARLEAKLRLRVIWYGNCVSVGHDGSGAIEFFQDHGGDEQAARRYAGVRAAAAIGSAM